MEELRRRNEDWMGNEQWRGWEATVVNVSMKVKKEEKKIWK
jgi:hypothetical protein